MLRRNQRLFVVGGALVGVLAVGSSVALAGIREGRRVECVSVSSGGAIGGDASTRPKLSADGRFVVSISRATNLVSGDTNGFADVFVRDRVTDTTERVSLGSAPANIQPAADCTEAAISADGRYVAFITAAGNLVAGDTNGADVFVRDRVTGTTERVSLSSSPENAQAAADCFEPAISADGRFVFFTSTAGNLVPGDTNNVSDVFVRDRNTGTTERVSVATGGTQVTGGNSKSAASSADGRFVAFVSDATNVVANDTNAALDVFLRDRTGGSTVRISVASDTTQANGASLAASINQDGRFIAYRSVATNLVTGDSNGKADIFVYDGQSGNTERVSLDDFGNAGNGDSDTPSISGDGTFVVFQSAASNLVMNGDFNGRADIFGRDRLLGHTFLVSSSALDVQSDQDSANPVISANGRTVAFDYTGTTLLPIPGGDTNGTSDIIVAWHVDPMPTRIAVYRPGAPAQWLLRDDDSTPTVIPFGGPGDLPVPADYRGIGRAQIAVFRPSNQTWFIRKQDGSPQSIQWGDASNNIPVARDYLGLGWAQIAVYRPNSQTWFIRKDDTGANTTIAWGAAGDIPVPGDYFGMGKTQLAVFRPSTREWFIRGENGRGTVVIQWGGPGDIPVPGNYFDVGHDQITVFRPSTGEWFIRHDNGSHTRIPFGGPGDLPVPGDYLWPGEMTLAVYRPATGTWFVADSLLGAKKIDLGIAGDMPVPAPYRGGPGP